MCSSDLVEQVLGAQKAADVVGTKGWLGEAGHGVVPCQGEMPGEAAPTLAEL